jgi:DNA-binding transcriptional MerR regulator
MDLMGIGEFARLSRLSSKALRLHDELGLLPPAHVDASSGYRFYEPAQLEQARLVSASRRLEVPLAEIRVIVGLEPSAAAEHIQEHWAAAAAEHAARRERLLPMPGPILLSGAPHKRVARAGLDDPPSVCAPHHSPVINAPKTPMPVICHRRFGAERTSCYPVGCHP